MDDKKLHGLTGSISDPKKYELSSNIPGANAPVNKPENKELEKLKGKLEDLKKKILKKYKFTMVLGLFPGQAGPMLEEEEGLPREIVDSKPMHMLMVMPEEQYKNLNKIKPEIVKLAKESGENLWVHIWTPVDLWNFGLDSKFDVIDAVAACMPLYDDGFLGALRVANIHKTLVLRKFEKYVASYVIGGSLTRGTARKDSDVDTFVIIDDTDVKRMPRLELLEKLRGIIWDYIKEASALAGVKNILNVQVYLLTDFWQNVKDAHPVHFTFIRDGVPLHDRGTFIPWKLLLKMGKIKPSTEAIDLYMKQGDQTEEFVKRRMMDSMVDIYWGVVTPTQALMMLAGEAPPVPKTIVQDVRDILVKRDKVMQASDLKILDKVVTLYKDYEHGKLKEVSGKEIDVLMKESKEYTKKMKELRKKIEKKMQEKTADQLYGDVFKLLKTILGNKSQEKLVQDFDKLLVKKGKVRPRELEILKKLVKVKAKIKGGRLDQKEVDSVKGDSIELMDALVEYSQRADLVSSAKSRMMIQGKDRKAELVLLGKDNFLIEGKVIKKISGGKLVKSNTGEFEKKIEDNKGKVRTEIPGEVFALIKKEFGNFEIVF